MAKAKAIDIVAVKIAVRENRLQTYLQMDYHGNLHIMLRDVENGEVVEIGRVPTPKEGK